MKAAHSRRQGKGPVPGARPGIAQPRLYFRNKGSIKSWPLTSSLGLDRQPLHRSSSLSQECPPDRLGTKILPAGRTTDVENYFSPETSVMSERPCAYVCVCVRAHAGRLQGQVTGLSEPRGTQGTETDGQPPPTPRWDRTVWAAPRDQASL